MQHRYSFLSAGSNLYCCFAHSDVTLKYAGVIFVCLCVYVHMVVHIHICIVYMNVNILPVFPHFHFLLSLNQFVTIHTISFGIGLKCEFLFYLVAVHFALLCIIFLCSLSYRLF